MRLKKLASLSVFCLVVEGNAAFFQFKKEVIAWDSMILA